MWRGVGGGPGPQAGGTWHCARSIEGGELFERIVDEDYQLTEVDTMVFVRQICDGVLFMHRMNVLHLDLKVLAGVSCDHSRSSAPSFHFPGPLANPG